MRKLRVDGRGRVTLEKTKKGVLIKPMVSKEVFLQSLEGCITKNNKAEMVAPRDLKKIWGSIH